MCCGRSRYCGNNDAFAGRAWVRGYNQACHDASLAALSLTKDINYYRYNNGCNGYNDYYGYNGYSGYNYGQYYGGQPFVTLDVDVNDGNHGGYGCC